MNIYHCCVYCCTGAWS